MSGQHRRDTVRISITTDADIVVARQEGRTLANQAGFLGTDQTLVATAISEIARNIVAHAGTGHIELQLVERDEQLGLKIVATDQGPGIDDVEQALEDGFTTGQGLGLGLPGARRIMDDFAITSKPGEGTRVIMHKWSRIDG
ncbi:MAG TPA: anti-sigma regulatory factor [Acidimicrobiales bacterium]